MINHYGLRLSLVLLLSITLAGCSGRASKPEEAKPALQTQPVGLQEVLKGKRVLAFFQNGTLSVVDPDFASVVQITALTPEQSPNRYTLDTFLVSPTHRYIAWYSPQLGIIAFDTENNTVKPVYRPTEWFNSNPYMQFNKDADLLSFIDSEGKQLLEYDFSQGQIKTTTIPYPFGTMFTSSPDKSKYLFISGYRQSIGYPEYLVTTTLGESVAKFSTKGELSQRTMIQWKSDSQSLITIENGSLITYTLTNGQATPFNKEAKFTNPKSLSVKDELVYVVDVDTIYIFTMEGKLKARIPTVIAQELNNPSFIPWSEQKFMIEETITTPESNYKRLWASDWKGVKKMLVTKYHETKTDTLTPPL